MTWMTDLLNSLLAAPGAQDADEARQHHYEDVQSRHKQVRVPHAQGVHHVLIHMEPAQTCGSLCRLFQNSQQ